MLYIFAEKLQKTTFLLNLLKARKFWWPKLLFDNF